MQISLTLWATIFTVTGVLHISHQRLARQRNVKRSLLHKPLVHMSKEDVEKEKLTAFVLMPEGIEESFKTWWGKIEANHEVDVRYPHDKHGLQCKGLDQIMPKSRKGSLFWNLLMRAHRRLDSRNPIHYFLPKFTAISTPKLNDPNYERKMTSSLVGEFNRIQMESG